MTPTARTIALDHLASAVPLFPDLPIGQPSVEGLDARDAALARAIDSAARRRWLTLEALLGPCMRRAMASVEPAVRAALLGGAAQLLLLVRVPDHAAIHETVEWAKRRVRPGAGGFVNAVLRRVVELRDGGEATAAGAADELPGRSEFLLENGSAIRLREPWLPDAAAPRLAAAASVAPGLVERWIAALGLAAACRLCRRGIVPASVILHGALSTDSSAGLRPHRRAGFFVFEGDDLTDLLRREPGLWVQDPASAAAVDGLDSDAAPRLAVDLCAGRGTKTRQMARRWPAARIVATDVDRRRRGTLASALRDCPGVEPVEPNAVESAVAAAGGADLVLLDVPCSNTGVLSRRLEARYRFTAARLKELVGMQRSILERGRALLRSGGLLAYATCSLEPEENASQWSWVERRLGLRRRAAEFMLPEGVPGDDATVLADGGGWAVFQSR